MDGLFSGPINWEGGGRCLCLCYVCNFWCLLGMCAPLMLQFYKCFEVGRSFDWWYDQVWCAAWMSLDGGGVVLCGVVFCLC